MNRWFKIGFIGAAIAIPLIILGVARYMVYSLTKPARITIKESPADYGLKYKDVEFPTDDGLIMQGWYILAKKSDYCIIMTHGGKGHRADPNIGMLEIAQGLASNGYNVMMYDLRGHGESDDGKMTGGYDELKDVQGAIAYVKGHGIRSQNIGLLGYSLGGAASLLAAAQDKELPAVVSDSSWANLTDLIKSQIARRTNMPTFLSPLVPGIAKRAYGVDITEAKPLDAVHKIAPRPIYFIHGEFDEVVPVENALRLYHSIDNPNNRLWVVPEAKHVSSYKARPDEYMEKVIGFFDQYLKK